MQLQPGAGTAATPTSSRSARARGTGSSQTSSTSGTHVRPAPLLRGDRHLLPVTLGYSRSSSRSRASPPATTSCAPARSRTRARPAPSTRIARDRPTRAPGASARIRSCATRSAASPRTCYSVRGRRAATRPRLDTQHQRSRDRQLPHRAPQPAGDPGCRCTQGDASTRCRSALYWNYAVQSERATATCDRVRGEPDSLRLRSATSPGGRRCVDFGADTRPVRPPPPPLRGAPQPDRWPRRAARTTSSGSSTSAAWCSGGRRMDARYSAHARQLAAARRCPGTRPTARTTAPSCRAT